MKLVWDTVQLQENCKHCNKIGIKKGKISKDQERIRRWTREGNRRASIEQAREGIAQMEREIYELNQQRASVIHNRKN